MKYIMLYSKLNNPFDIFNMITYFRHHNYLELVPYDIFTQEKDDQTLFLVDYENDTFEVINGIQKCIEFLSNQSLIIHLKDKAFDYIKYIDQKKNQ